MWLGRGNSVGSWPPVFPRFQELLASILFILGLFLRIVFRHHYFTILWTTLCCCCADIKSPFKIAYVISDLQWYANYSFIVKIERDIHDFIFKNRDYLNCGFLIKGTSQILIRVWRADPIITIFSLNCNKQHSKLTYM